LFILRLNPLCFWKEYLCKGREDWEILKNKIQIHPTKKIIHRGGKAIMKIQEVRKIAGTWDVDAGAGRSKGDIIRDIQIREGYSPCFGTKETCDSDCMWKADCLRKR
jgi:hypothetical protein